MKTPTILLVLVLLIGVNSCGSKKNALSKAIVETRTKTRYRFINGVINESRPILIWIDNLTTDGRVVKRENYRRGQLFSTTLYIYNTQRKMIKEIEKVDNEEILVIVYNYNNEGRLIGGAGKGYSGGEVGYRYEYNYDQNGFLFSRIGINSLGEKYSEHRYQYNEDGLMSEDINIGVSDSSQMVEKRFYENDKLVKDLMYYGDETTPFMMHTYTYNRFNQPLLATPPLIWTTIKSTNGDFEFQMPSEPTKQIQSISDAEILIYNLDLVDIIYGVAYINTTAWTDGYTTEEHEYLFKDMLEGTLSVCDCRIISEQNQSTYDKYQKEIKYELKVAGVIFHYYKRFIFIGAHTYQLTFGVLSDKDLELISNKDKFFNSFKTEP